MAQSILEVTYNHVYGYLNAAYQWDESERNGLFHSYWDFASTFTPEQHRQLLTMYLDAIVEPETRSTIEDSDQWQKFELSFFQFITNEKLRVEKKGEFFSRFKNTLVIAAAEFMNEEYQDYCLDLQNNPPLQLHDWLAVNMDLLESAIANLDGDINTPDLIVDHLLRSERSEQK